MRLELIVDGKVYMNELVSSCELEYKTHQYKVIGFERSASSWSVFLLISSKMNEEETKSIANIKQVVKLKKAGWSMRELATKFNLSDTTITRMIKDHENDLFNEEVKAYEQAK